MIKLKRKTIVLLCVSAFFAVFFGTALGLLLAQTLNVMNTEYFTEFTQALPTRLLDINGELITEFASDEKREIITFEDLPQHMIDALITREDQIFYKHQGFSAKALVRAVLGVITRSQRGGGSTITQQIAGILYADRSERSITRKLRELWWAIQMERRFSKNEILELYLNKVYLGGGTYGVNAASKYYFGHGATEITPAEAAILVIQLSNPAQFNPFEYPNRARDRQQSVLSQMVENGYLTREAAVASFEDYWTNFDYTRINTSAYFMRDDKAPWFSAYVLSQLSSMIYGNLDVYTGGFTVNTTLNLKHQEKAQELMSENLDSVNSRFRNASGVRKNAALSTYIPLTELLALTFNLPQLKVSGERVEIEALSAYQKQINPTLDVLSLMFGMENLKVSIVNRANAKLQQDTGASTIEGALISLENSTGYITALVGGGKFGPDNQFIRATQARVQPGSTFKPLYYSAAIDSRKFTAVSVLDDVPTVFYNQGVPYIPNNFLSLSEGQVQLWYALAKSMNVPSVKVMEGIGFDAAIERTTALLGISAEELPSRNFERVYPLALGTCSVRPIELARAYAIFANQGKAVDPIAIRSVLDRNGKLFLDPERELRVEQRNRGGAIQVISPQNAFIMTDILQKSVQLGTLGRASQYGKMFDYNDANGKKYRLPAAGKTGTTQNWMDAWAVGFTPHITTAIWFGFDSRKSGQTLGVELTGSTLTGHIWAQYMRVANEDYPMKNFVEPQTGLIKASVCSVSGLILTPACGNHVTTQYFLEGTQPTALCDYHITRETVQTLGVTRLEEERFKSGIAGPVIDDGGLVMPDLPFLNSSAVSGGVGSPYESSSGSQTAPAAPETAPTFNFFLD